MNRARNPIWLRKVDDDERPRCQHVHGDCDFLPCIKSTDGTTCTSTAEYVLTDTPYCSGHVVPELSAVMFVSKVLAEGPQEDVA